MDKKPYQLSADEIALKFNVDVRKGLSSAEANKRLLSYGHNQIEQKKKINPFKLFIGQFEDFLIRILIAAGLLSIVVGIIQSGTESADDIFDGILILFIVVLVAIVGFFNEYKAEKTIEALKKLIALKAKVLRDGEVTEIDAKDLVPGDIVMLEEGEKVPADIRLLDVSSLQAIEASLTGESQPVYKTVDVVSSEVTIGDRKNMVFSGTSIASGKGLGVIVGTASNTEIGHIATMVEEAPESETPMQKKLDKLGAQMGKGIMAVCAVVFVILIFFVKEIAHLHIFERLMAAFIASVALAVAAIPEGLAFVVRISLALGARRMAKRNALIRSLPAVEALGSTDVICSDKTGTLTKGEMTVTEIFSGGKVYSVTGTGYEGVGEFQLDGVKLENTTELEALLRIGVLCNSATYRDEKILGDPTEGSLLVAASKIGILKKDLEIKYPKVFEVPFSSDRKMMSTIHKSDSGYLVAAKGATEVLLTHATKILIDGQAVALTDELRDRILAESERMSKKALRVLILAYKETTVLLKTPEEIEGDLIVVGLQGMIDPPRVEIRETIDKLTKQSGMKVIMITGDHVETAKAVAHEIGIEGEAITGVELDKLSQEEFEQKADQIAIYARVNPEHKIRIVQALKKHGHQVAMTGDGVNDAPAIKASDIGIAMGITGTDVAKETADVILLDDHFLTIVNAVEEGRGIFDNVRKFVNYLISCNIAEVLLILFGSIFYGQLVLSALQLLFINIVTDGLPAIALGSDPAEKGIMNYSPKRFQSQIVNKRLWVEMFIFGIVMTVLVLIPFGSNVKGAGGYEHAVAVAFMSTVMLEMVRLISLRSDYKISWTSNLWLIGAIISSIAIQLLVSYSPLSKRFMAQGVNGGDWVVILISGIILFIVMKIARRVLNKFFPPEMTRSGMVHA